METTGPYYVYVYLNPLKTGEYKFDDLFFEFEPFYVGKGFGERYKKHIWLAQNKSNDLNKHKINTIKKIFKEKLEPIIVFYKKDISHDESCSLEISLISKIGRKDLKKGPLTNLTDGGEGSYNRIVSFETRQKISKVDRSGKNNSRFGVKLTQDTIDKIRKGNLGKKYSKEINAKKACKGNKNGMFKKSLYDRWLEKFGKEIADEKYQNWRKKMKKK